MSWRGQVMAYGAPPAPPSTDGILDRVPGLREAIEPKGGEAARGVPWPDPAVGAGPQRQTVAAWWDGQTLRVKVTLDGHIIAEAEADGSQLTFTMPRST